MKRLVTTVLGCAFALQVSAVLADEAKVTWLDAKCRYFVVKLPDSGEPEKFGLFSVRAMPMPAIGDALKGSMTSIELHLENVTTGQIHDVIHWADAKTQEQLVKEAAAKCSGKDNE